MGLKRGLSGVNRIRGGGGSRSAALVILVFLCVFAPLVFFVGRGVYIDSSNGITTLIRVTLSLNHFAWKWHWWWWSVADYANASVKQVRLENSLFRFNTSQAMVFVSLDWLQSLDWRERLAMQSLRSLFSKEASVLTKFCFVCSFFLHRLAARFLLRF